MVVSLQVAREFVNDVENACISQDIKWFNIPLEGANTTLLKSKLTRDMV